MAMLTESVVICQPPTTQLDFYTTMDGCFFLIITQTVMCELSISFKTKK
jgi:hypothetical protein